MNVLHTGKVHHISSYIWLGIALAIGSNPTAYAQLSHIEHFVSPTYPPLARQAMISGQVTFEVNIDRDGAVTGASEIKSAHPLLTQWAKTCIEEWKFHPEARERRITVVFYYAFSGTKRETNPQTTVKADFTGSSARVFITTDPPPTAYP